MTDNHLGLTARLAEVVTGLRFEELPVGVVDHAKLCLLDTIGCGLHGSTLPWVRLVCDTVARLEGGDGATIWGTRKRSTAPSAAMINGMAVHGFELDDLHSRSIVHPGSVVVSAALAAAEITEGTSGRDLVTAMVAGYEVAARVGAALGAAHLVQGWHPTGTHGTLGAAAGVGSILGLAPSEMLHAIGTAGSHSSGLMAAQFSSMVKRLHAGHAAHSGLLSAFLARDGFLGIPDLLENTYGGYLSTFAPSSRPELITEGLGDDWQLAHVGFKPYATNGSCHPTIDSLLAMRAERGLMVHDVEHVMIRCSTATKKHVGWAYEPDSVTTAQMNLPYIVAVTLTDGDAFVDQFTPERVADPALVEVSRRVSVIADPEIDGGGDADRHLTRLEVTLTDGTVLRDVRHAARGSAASPLSAVEVAEKFMKLATTVMSPNRALTLREIVMSIDEISDLGSLTEAITG